MAGGHEVRGRTLGKSIGIIVVIPKVTKCHTIVFMFKKGELFIGIEKLPALIPVGLR